MTLMTFQQRITLFAFCCCCACSFKTVIFSSASTVADENDFDIINTDDDEKPSTFLKPSFKNNKLSSSSNNTSLNNNSAQYEHETRLLQELFGNRNYNKEATPSLKIGQPNEIALELYILKIDEVIEVEQEIVMSAFLKINWTDSRLSWQPGEFGGLEWLVCSSRVLWLPDVALINSNDVYQLTRDSRFPATVANNGRILFVPAGKIRVRCELELKNYPWDQQICLIRFESWMYPDSVVRIVGKYITVDHSHFVSNPQWLVANSSTKNIIVKYEDYSFSRVDFQLVLERKSLFQVTYTIFPCLALTVLQICSHILPFHDSQRITFATTALMSFAIFHISIIDQMPKTSDEMPSLAIYVDSLMCLIVISLLECFFCLQWISRIGRTVPSPFFWWLVVEKLGSITALGSNGVYWRKKYLIVYERTLVNANFDRLQLTNTHVFEERRQRSSRSDNKRFFNFRDHHQQSAPTSPDISSGYYFDRHLSSYFNNRQFMTSKLPLRSRINNYYLRKLLDRSIRLVGGWSSLMADNKNNSEQSDRLLGGSNNKNVKYSKNNASNNNQNKKRKNSNNDELGIAGINVGNDGQFDHNWIEDIRVASPSSPHSPLFSFTATSSNNKTLSNPPQSQPLTRHFNKGSACDIGAPPTAAFSPLLANNLWIPHSTATPSDLFNYCTICGTSCGVVHRSHQQQFGSNNCEDAKNRLSCLDAAIAGCAGGSNNAYQPLRNSQQPLAHSECIAFNEWRHSALIQSPTANENSFFNKINNSYTPIIATTTTANGKNKRVFPPNTQQQQRGKSNLRLAYSSENNNCAIRPSSLNLSQTVGEEYHVKTLQEMSRLLANIDCRNWQADLRNDCHGIWKVFITVIDQLITYVLLFASAMLPFVLFVFNSGKTNKDPSNAVITMNDTERTAVNLWSSST